MYTLIIVQCLSIKEGVVLEKMLILMAKSPFIMYLPDDMNVKFTTIYEPQFITVWH